jgi:hypothetical protein
MRVDNERQEINEEVLCEYGFESWSWNTFQEILNEVPEEYRKVALVELDDGGDGCTCKLIISYRRYETDKEYDWRIQRENNAEALSEARAECDERALFERLNVKYGPGGTARVAKPIQGCDYSVPQSRENY